MVVKNIRGVIKNGKKIRICLDAKCGNPKKFNAREKENILNQVRQFVEKSEKLKKRVSRIAMRGYRIYLYELVEQTILEGAILIKPLIDDKYKYLEFPYARLTLRNVKGTVCSADWRRHNDQWMTLHEGTLEECLHYVEEDGGWFG